LVSRVNYVEVFGVSRLEVWYCRYRDLGWIEAFVDEGADDGFIPYTLDSVANGEVASGLVWLTGNLQCVNEVHQFIACQQ
jgi:hypothetical protein